MGGEGEAHPPLLKFMRGSAPQTPHIWHFGRVFQDFHKSKKTRNAILRYPSNFYNEISVLDLFRDKKDGSISVPLER